jgi:hypothetical protein
MIIVNQERTKIINFEKITEITASGTRILVGDDIFIPKGEEIAKYETEERAKDVLQEIISKYKTTLYNSKTNETVVNVPKVYEMPTK